MTHTTHNTHRLSLPLLAALWLMTPSVVMAAGPTLTFSPHCTASIADTDNPFGGALPSIDALIAPGKQMANCPTFEIHDPQSLQTDVLTEGQTLEIVPVIDNKDHASITGAHVWLSYDPTILKGVSITIDPSLPIPTPGESDFDEKDGYAKIGGSVQTPLTGSLLPIAIVRFTVLKTTSVSTIISYFEPGSSKESHTTIVGTSAGSDQSMLSSDPLGSLLVRLDTGEAATAASSLTVATSSAPAVVTSSVASPPKAMPSIPSFGAVFPLGTPKKDPQFNAAAPVKQPQASSAPASKKDSIFPDLQVTNLRVTTQGASAFLGWDALPSTDLAGYNVYYGAVSGQYLQRKTIDQSETTLTIRDLPEGTIYYFALRGVNEAGEETDFSKEVSVEIGDPKTSTAPLTASLVDNGPNGKNPNTGGSVSGNTGTASNILLLVAMCASIGTFLAFRRQMIAHTQLPNV